MGAGGKGPGGCRRGMWGGGGGLNIFFGAEIPTKCAINNFWTRNPRGLLG